MLDRKTMWKRNTNVSYRMLWCGHFMQQPRGGLRAKKNPEQTQVHLNVIIQKTAEASGGKFESQTERKNYVVLRNLSSYPMRVLLCRACALWSLTQPNAQHYLQTRQRERKKRWRCPVLWLYTIHVNGPIDNEKCDSSQKVASLQVWNVSPAGPDEKKKSKIISWVFFAHTNVDMMSCYSKYKTLIYSWCPLALTASDSYLSFPNACRVTIATARDHMIAALIAT